MQTIEERTVAAPVARKPTTSADLSKELADTGRPESIDICDTSGAVLGDDHRFAENQAASLWAGNRKRSLDSQVLHCIGISLGRPKTVTIEAGQSRAGRAGRGRAELQKLRLKTTDLEPGYRWR